MSNNTKISKNDDKSFTKNNKKNNKKEKNPKNKKTKWKKSSRGFTGESSDLNGYVSSGNGYI